MTADNSLKPAWSVHRLAEAAGLTVNTVRSMGRNGRIPAVRIGRAYRIPHDVAVAFIEGRPLPRTDDRQSGSVPA